MEPDALAPNLSYTEFVYNNESDVTPLYWPLAISQLATKRNAYELYTDNPDQYITYSGDWQSLLVSREKEGRYRSFTLRAYSGDSFKFYISTPSGVADSRYYSGPLTVSGVYNTLQEYASENDARTNAITFTAPSGNSYVYSLPQVLPIDWVRLHHQAIASGESYRLYQFLPRTLIQVDDLEADVIDAVTVRVSDSIIVTADDLAPGSITGEKILAGTISGVLITPGTITASLIQANSITASLLDVDELSAVATKTGSLEVTNLITVTSGEIDAGLVKMDQTGITIGSFTEELTDTNTVRIRGKLNPSGGNVVGMAIYNSLNPTTPHAVFQTDFDNAVEIENLAVDGVTNINIPQGDYDYAFQVWVAEPTFPQLAVGYGYVDISTELVIHGFDTSDYLTATTLTNTLIDHKGDINASGIITSPLFTLPGSTAFWDNNQGFVTDNNITLLGPASTVTLTDGTVDRIVMTKGSIYTYTPNAVPSTILDTGGGGFYLYNKDILLHPTWGQPSSVYIGSDGSASFSVSVSSAIIGAANGTISSPSFRFSNDTNTGIYRYAEDGLSIATGGVDAVRFGPAQVLGTNGSQSVPSYSFANDPDTGIYRLFGGIGFSMNNSIAAYISTNNIFAVNTTNQNGQITAQVPDGTARNVLTLIQNNSASPFVNFASAIGVGEPIQTSALGTYYGKIRVQANGTIRWIALYNT